MELHQNVSQGFLIRPLITNFNKITLDESPHRHNFQEIIWVESGKGTQSIDDELIQLKPNTFYFIGKGQVHFFHEGVNLKGFLIRFSDSFLPNEDHRSSTAHNASFLSRMIHTNSISIDVIKRNHIEQIIHLLHQEFTQEHSEFGRIVILQHLLSTILIRLERLCKEQSLQDIQNINDIRMLKYREFLHVLENHFQTQHSVPFYSQTIGMTRRKLSETVKHFSGKTAKHIIIERIITEAKRFLSFTNCSLKEITYKLGYEDPAYFCRLFKQQTGFTPQNYKKQNLLSA